MHGSMNAAYRDHMLTKKGPWVVSSQGTLRASLPSLKPSRLGMSALPTPPMFTCVAEVGAV